MSTIPRPNTPRRDKTFNLRLDVELYDAAMAKAEYGLGAAIRALLRGYVRGDIEIQPADMLHELTSAPRVRRKPRKPPAKRPK
jgi:hypothetical protein